MDRRSRRTDLVRITAESLRLNFTHKTQRSSENPARMKADRVVRHSLSRCMLVGKMIPGSLEKALYTERRWTRSLLINKEGWNECGASERQSKHQPDKFKLETSQNTIGSRQAKQLHKTIHSINLSILCISRSLLSVTSLYIMFRKLHIAFIVPFPLSFATLLA
jgi:hypothetical protein